MKGTEKEPGMGFRFVIVPNDRLRNEIWLVLVQGIHGFEFSMHHPLARIVPFNDLWSLIGTHM